MFKKKAKIIRKASGKKAVEKLEKKVAETPAPHPTETETGILSGAGSTMIINASGSGFTPPKNCAIKGCLNEVAEGSIYCGSCKRDLHF